MGILVALAVEGALTFLSKLVFPTRNSSQDPLLILLPTPQMGQM
jgi:hypothetical protein